MSVRTSRFPSFASRFASNSARLKRMSCRSVYAAERGDDAIEIDLIAAADAVEVKQIPTLPTLVEGTKLRTEQLVELKGRNGGLTGEPAALHAKPRRGEAMHGEVLMRVRLHLHPHPTARRRLG